MRSWFLVLLLAACGGSTRNDVPDHGVCHSASPPPECAIQCDQSPGATVVCPQGFYCVDGRCDEQCGQPGDPPCPLDQVCSDDGRCAPAEEACVNLECRQVDCPATTGTTKISGKVYAPNGQLPLFGVAVYVPNAAVGPLPDGLTCSRCTDELPGSPLVQTISAPDGSFVIDNAPTGADIPLVITTGKWRRQIVIPFVPACETTELTADDTHLPSKKSEGDMPQIAISTGLADALECLFIKLGIDESEFTSQLEDGRVHMYADRLAPSGLGADRFAPGFGGGTGPFSDSANLWGGVDQLASYDMVILSCEGGQYPPSKPQASLDAMKAYADRGGRVFLSHWHNIWIEGGGQEGGSQIPAVWPEIAAWTNDDITFEGIDRIDEVHNPKGGAFAEWMLAVGGSTVRDEIELTENTGKNTVLSVDNARAETWVTWNDGARDLPQNFLFTTPNEAPLADRCGKVVFSDMHVSGDSQSNAGDPGFPADCSSAPLTPQEKALAFMMFDLAGCVDVIP